VIIKTARHVTGGLGMRLVTASHDGDQKNNQCCTMPEAESSVSTVQSSIQWNLRIKDTLGAELLSSFRRLSFGGRFEPIYNL